MIHRLLPFLPLILVACYFALDLWMHWAYWRWAFRELIIDIRFAWRFRGTTYYIMGVPCGPLVRRTYRRVYGSPYRANNSPSNSGQASSSVSPCVRRNKPRWPASSNANCNFCSGKHLRQDGTVAYSWIREGALCLK